MYCGSGTGFRCWICARHTMPVQCALTSWQHFSVRNDIFKVWHQSENLTPSVDAYLLEEQSNPAKFHPDPIWNDGDLGFFKTVTPLSSSGLHSPDYQRHGTGRPRQTWLRTVEMICIHSISVWRRQGGTLGIDRCGDYIVLTCSESEEEEPGEVTRTRTRWVGSMDQFLIQKSTLAYTVHRMECVRMQKLLQNDSKLTIGMQIMSDDNNDDDSNHNN